jgi:cysteine desulfuration protein SufE
MAMPDRLQSIVDQFAAAPRDIRVQALLDYSHRVPPLPDELAANPERLEQVHECQTPFFLATEVDREGSVHLFFDCPPETPTVRGFAGILREGLEGETYERVLEVPPDFYARMGLQEVVSALRLRGMGAILARLKRQIREATNVASATDTEPGE